MVVNLGYVDRNAERVLSPVKAAEMGFLLRDHDVTLCNKLRHQEIHLNVKVDPLRTENPNCDGLAMCPECPKTGWRGESYWSHPQESDSEGGVVVFPIWLSSALVWILQNFQRLLECRRYFETTYGCCPCDPSERKSECRSE